MPLFLAVVDVSIITPAAVALSTAIGFLWRRLIFVEDSRYKDQAQFLQVMSDSIAAIKELTSEVKRLSEARNDK